MSIAVTAWPLKPLSLKNNGGTDSKDTEGFAVDLVVAIDVDLCAAFVTD